MNIFGAGSSLRIYCCGLYLKVPVILTVLESLESDIVDDGYQ